MFIQIEKGFFMVAGGDGGPGISCYKDCNIFLLEDDGEAMLFDAGSGIDTGQIMKNIEETGVKTEQIRYLFVTHCHGDHTGGLREMQKLIPGCQVVASREEKRLIESGTEYELGLIAAKKKGAYPQDYVFHHGKVDLIAQDGQEYRVGGMTIEPMITPGHSIESVCYLVKRRGRKYLFSGDSVYKNGALSLQNCYGSSLEAYRNSFPKLAGLQVDALIPAHFGFPLTNGQKHIDKALEYLQSSALPPMV